MKEKYILPTVTIVQVETKHQLLTTSSMTVDSSNKVSNSEDIGFVKKEFSQDDSNFWGD